MQREAFEQICVHGFSVHIDASSVAAVLPIVIHREGVASSLPASRLWRDRARVLARTFGIRTEKSFFAMTERATKEEWNAYGIRIV
jgi:hypothetical protein